MESPGFIGHNWMLVTTLYVTELIRGPRLSESSGWLLAATPVVPASHVISHQANGNIVVRKVDACNILPLITSPFTHCPHTKWNIIYHLGVCFYYCYLRSLPTNCLFHRKNIFSPLARLITYDNL